jgi:hypothetical protein
MAAQPDELPRTTRTHPLTKEEFAALVCILTLPELLAVMELQSDQQRLALGRQLLRDAPLAPLH